MFYLYSTVLFIWFTGTLAKLVQRLIPEKEVVSLEIITPKFLSEELLHTPSLALDAARFEGQRLGEIASNMVHQFGPAIQTRDMPQLEALEKMDDQVDVLQEKIIEYLGEIHKQELTEKQSGDLLLLIKGVDEIERIANVVRSDLIPLGRTIFENGVEATETTRHILEALYERVCQSVQQSIGAIGEVDQNKALEVINMKPEINRLVTEALRYQAQRVSPTTPDLIAMFRLEDEVIESLKRIYDLSKRLAKLMLPAVVSTKEA